MTNAGTASDAAKADKPRAQAPKGAVPFFELSRLMVVAVLASTSQLVRKAQTKPDGPWEPNWTQLAPGAIRQYVVVRDLTPPTG